MSPPNLNDRARDNWEPLLAIAEAYRRADTSPLVYLDSLVLEGGQSTFSVVPANVVAARRKLVAEQGLGIAIPPPPVTAFGIPEDHPQAAWVRRHLTPHPVGTYESTLRLEHPVGNGRPRTYIHCTNPVYGPAEALRQWVRQQQGCGWAGDRDCARRHGDSSCRSRADASRRQDRGMITSLDLA